MPRPIRLLAVPFALVALAGAGLTACGEDAPSGSADAGALIKDTFGAGHPIRSGRVDATLDVALNGSALLSQPLALHLSGRFQSNGGKSLPDFALELDLNGGAQPITVGTTFTQGQGFLTIEGQAFSLGREAYNSFKRGYAQAKSGSNASSRAAPSLAALGISPLRWLRDPQHQGREDIAGTPTDHVTADVDVTKFLDDLSRLLARARNVTRAGAAATATAIPKQLTAQQRDAVARSIARASLDVWTGVRDHALRKLALAIDIAVPEELRAQAGGLRDGRLRFQATLAQLNQRQRIAKPADARPIRELRAVLQQLGLIGHSSGSASTTTPPAADPQGAYAACLGAAGQDLAKVQQCADLLK